MDQLRFFKIRSDICLPTRGSELSAGVDIYCPEETVLPPFKQRLIKTGLKVILPCGTYGRIAPRSGLALHHNIWINGGVIDADYTGELGVIVINMGNVPYVVEKNSKFCQLLCEKIVIPKIEETFTMPITKRATNGFGSTN